MFGKRAAFWVGVGVVSVVSQFVLEAASDAFPSLGLSRFTAYAHKGASL